MKFLEILERIEEIDQGIVCSSPRAFHPDNLRDLERLFELVGDDKHWQSAKTECQQKLGEFLNLANQQPGGGELARQFEAVMGEIKSGQTYGKSQRAMANKFIKEYAKLEGHNGI